METIVAQTLQTSDSPSATFTIAADANAQADWNSWQKDELPPGTPVPHIMVTFMILSPGQLQDGEYALWRRKMVNKVWVPDGGTHGSTKLDLLPDGSQSLLMDWDGQDYAGKITVATEFACTIAKMSVQVIYAPPVLISK